MKKIITVKDFLWDHYHPEFEFGKEYMLKDELADKMVKHGYANFVKEKKAAKNDGEKKMPAHQNKKMDLDGKVNKSNEASAEK